MRTLPSVVPTPEQLSILSENAPGVMLIRGAAGSGKTTTAILRLRAQAAFFASRAARLRRSEPVRVLVLTFNRTLKGYVEQLVREQVGALAGVHVEVSTFGKWARERLGRPTMVEEEDRSSLLRGFGENIPLDPAFLVQEVEYVLGRFLPKDFNQYLKVRRTGRGITPRVDQPVRRAILADVIEKYQEWKHAHALVDWADLAVQIAESPTLPLYDVIIADECQDYSANELRAIRGHLRDDHSLTLIIDSVQRIYAKGFTWNEIGITVRPETIRKLVVNYRNTRQIAQFARPLVADVPLDEDGTLPDFSRSTRDGPKPAVLVGQFGRQVRWAIDYLEHKVDLERESVAFLHPKGGGWFTHLRESLAEAGIEYVDLSRESDWPTDDVNVGLVTLHSAKGLEFDHVFILGVSRDTLPATVDDEDTQNRLRRLLAVGIGRARKFVCLGYKQGEAAEVIKFLDPDTYDAIAL